jgi:glycosyltransferase involved in cell wall biosynthesis
MEPKLIKGPDIFLKALEVLKRDIPEIFVLLTGPSRGFVKKGLERLKIQYKHINLKDYSAIGRYYSVLDLYLVTSREEGGPRAVLESFASGVPLVTTRVGQAIDMVNHEENGWIVDIDDYEGLAYWSKYALENKNNIGNILLNARNLAEDNCYKSQLSLWHYFMQGYVD